MGKKKSHKKKEYAYAEPAGDAEQDADGDAGFAARLLSTMGIDTSDKKVEEEAVDTEEPEPEPEVKHPHLRSLHQSFKQVFKRDSKSRSDSDSVEEEPSKGAESNAAAPTEKDESFVDAAEHDSARIKPSSKEPLSNLDNQAPGEAAGSGAPASGAPASGASSDGASGASSSGTASTNAAGDAPGKKRNRRKEKLAERERERIRIVQQAQAEAETEPDKRLIELKGMGMMIDTAGLQEFEVQPDGHCLFHSLSDQLEQRRSITVDAQELRSQLANYIRSNADDFVPYLISEETGEVQDLENYTSDLENTPMWGGDLEIMAASRLYGVPIRVFFASQPALTINEEQFAHETPLTLAFYQAKFGLGAHYNSLRDKSAGETPQEA